MAPSMAPSMEPSMEPSMAADLMFFVKVPATQKLILGDWIAQWDTTYGAWFFYNINTGRRLSRFRQNILRGFANTLPWHNVQTVSHQTMHLVSLMIHLSSRGSFGPTEPGKVV